MLFTIGHSTRSLEEFLGLLRENGVEKLVDIRTVPRSRHNPQFNIDSLPDKLAGAGIHYEHMRGLGGLRHARKDSPNTGLRNESFRGYADYMQTDEFEQALSQLAQGSEQRRIAIMCAEAVPWRCHRSLVSDALAARGIEVRHILAHGQTRPHTLSKAAHVDGTRVTYPPEQPGLEFDHDRNKTGV